MVLICLIAGYLLVQDPSGRAALPPEPAFAAVKLLGRGINLGNILEAPREGAWGLSLEAEFFPIIKKGGFDSVRIPIRWSAHAETRPPYGIDPAFLNRVDWAVEQAFGQNLAVVINVHHYDEIFSNPEEHKERFLAVWRQLSEHYRDRPERLFFELLNEPHDKLTEALWNEYLRDALKIVRESNPTRPIIIGPGRWNNIAALESLQLPADDRRLIVTVHFYEPFRFTHQGATWARGSDQWLGTTWGSDKEQEAVRTHFKTAAEWSAKEGRPLYLGEFGAYSKAHLKSRAAWTRCVREQAEKHGMAWAYWEFASGFGAYDLRERRWRQPLLDALIGR